MSPGAWGWSGENWPSAARPYLCAFPRSKGRGPIEGPGLGLRDSGSGDHYRQSLCSWSHTFLRQRPFRLSTAHFRLAQERGAAVVGRGVRRVTDHAPLRRGQVLAKSGARLTSDFRTYGGYFPPTLPGHRRPLDTNSSLASSLFFRLKCRGKWPWGTCPDSGGTTHHGNGRSYGTHASSEGSSHENGRQ